MSWQPAIGGLTLDELEALEERAAIAEWVRRTERSGGFNLRKLRKMKVVAQMGAGIGRKGGTSAASRELGIDRDKGDAGCLYPPVLRRMAASCGLSRLTRYAIITARRFVAASVQTRPSCRILPRCSRARRSSAAPTCSASPAGRGR